MWHMHTGSCSLRRASQPHLQMAALQMVSALGTAYIVAERLKNLTLSTGAKAINGKPLARIEVHGKNLFYFFGPAEQPEVVHIHFGMSGKLILEGAD